MKLNSWKQFISGVVLTLAFGGLTNADIVIDFTTDSGFSAMPATSTGDLLDGGFRDSQLPMMFDVVEDTTQGLQIIINSISSFDSALNDADTTINGADTSFGVNSPTPPVGTESASRFDVDAAETLVFSFNQDVFIENVDLGNLTGAEEFNFGSQTGISDANTNGSDIFDFTAGGTTQGLFLAAGDTILVEAAGPAGSSVGIQAIDVTVVAVPEPSSIAFLGLLGLGAIVRRRR